MEKLRLNTQLVDKVNPNSAPRDTVMKSLGVRAEFRVDNVWQNTPEKGFTDKRYLFPDTESFRAGQDTYFAWQFLEGRKVDNPVLPAESIKRILYSRTTGESLCLFVPWGVRPTGRFGDPENQVLDMLSATQEMLRKRRVNAQLLVMPADLYATEVNNQVSVGATKNYFEEVGDAAVKRGFEVKPWSQIRQENMDQYLCRVAELKEKGFAGTLKASLLQEALGAAKRRSGYINPEDIKEASYRYLRERICEAEIVEDTICPIKVSVVVKEKDNQVDRMLPRIYIIPDRQRFPWLKQS